MAQQQPQAKPCASYLALGQRVMKTSPEPSMPWWEEMYSLPIKQQPITSYLGICPNYLCKKETVLLLFFVFCALFLFH